MGLHELIHADNGVEKLLAEEVLLKSSHLSTQIPVCSHRVIQTEVFGGRVLLFYHVFFFILTLLWHSDCSSKEGRVCVIEPDDTDYYQKVVMSSIHSHFQRDQQTTQQLDRPVPSCALWLLHYPGILLDHLRLKSCHATIITLIRWGFFISRLVSVRSCCEKKIQIPAALLFF